MVTSSKSGEYYRGTADAERYGQIGVPSSVRVDVNLDYGDGVIVLHDVSPDYIQGLADAGLLTLSGKGEL